MTTRVIKNIGELTTNDPTVGTGATGRLHDTAMVIDDAHVLWVGPNAQAPAADEMIDAQGSAVIPGFVDSHTHLVFAGERSGEFEARMSGTPYDGGGISNTVASTRAASSDELRRSTEKRLRELRGGGATTVEIKSGYALNVEGESRLIDIANEFSDEVTFLGAHVVPEEYARDREGYVDLVRGSMLATCAPKSKWADVFCDQGAFDVDESRAILTAAKSAGLQLRVHGNQLGTTGGVALAVEMDAASVDHCTFLSDDDVDQLCASQTVATLLPGADFSTRADYSSARRLRDRGAIVALATDCNPGTSYVTSMPFVLAIAVRDMRMDFDDALWSATRGGAAALRRDDVGHLGVGARADVVILDAPRAAHLAYRPGTSIVRRVIVAEGNWSSASWFSRAHGTIDDA
jgi:imidazolonepropionase